MMYRSNHCVMDKYGFTDLHDIFYDWSPSGKVVLLLLGAIPSVWFAREETRLKKENKKRPTTGLKKWNCIYFCKSQPSATATFNEEKPKQQIKDVLPRTDVMIGTPSSFQFSMNSRSSSILTCWISLLKFSSVVPVWSKNKPKWKSWLAANVQFSNVLCVFGLDVILGENDTIEAEDVEQHSSDLVVGAVRVEQHRQQSPHRIFHLCPVYI